MIISHKHKFVFLHNPKVAGSAIRKAMEHLHDDGTEFWHQKFFPQLDRVVDAAHLTFHDCKLVAPATIEDRYTFFTAVRNPYTRFVSGLLEFGRQHGIVLDTWNKVRFHLERMTPAALRFDWQYIHLCPQHYFAPPENSGISRFYAAHEEMAQDWGKWTQIIGMPDLELPKVRVRPDPENDVLRVSNIPVDILEWVNATYYEDFLRFGYRKGGAVMNYASHYERVNGIHSPYLVRPQFDDCTMGEQIAFNQQYPRS